VQSSLIIFITIIILILILVRALRKKNTPEYTKSSTSHAHSRPMSVVEKNVNVVEHSTEKQAPTP
jgi:hypothetical protein